MSVGADLGFINLSFAVDSVNLKDVAELVQEHAYHNATDNAIPESSGQNGVSGMGFDMGVGVYYATSTWWAGVSYGHVTQPVLEWSDQTEVPVRGSFYAAGGYNWRLRDKKWVLMLLCHPRPQQERERMHSSSRKEKTASSPLKADPIPF